MYCVRLLPGIVGKTYGKFQEIRIEEILCSHFFLNIIYSVYFAENGSPSITIIRLITSILEKFYRRINFIILLI